MAILLQFDNKPELEDDVIKIIPLKEADFESLYQVASDPLIWEQHPNKDRYRKDVFKTFFEGAILSNSAFIVLAKNTGEIIGSSRYYDLKQSSIKIGYTFIGRKFWGKGHNQALKKLMINHAFKYVNSIFFQIGSENIRSQKAIENIGAQKVGEEEIAYYGEKSRPNFIFRITKDKWGEIIQEAGDF